MFQSKSFNPHTHAGCDRLVIEVLPRQEGFNPHTHAGCDYDKNFAEMDIESFNPHTHAGCDSFTAVTLQVGEVSIHTPTQGVTY